MSNIGARPTALPIAHHGCSRDILSSTNISVINSKHNLTSIDNNLWHLISPVSLLIPFFWSIGEWQFFMLEILQVYCIFYIDQWSFTPLSLNFLVSYSERFIYFRAWHIQVAFFSFHVIPINVDVLHFNFMWKLFIMQSHMHVQGTSFFHTIYDNKRRIYICTNFSSMFDVLLFFFLLLECVQHVNGFLRILELLYFYNSWNILSGSYSQVHFSNVILYYAWCIDACCMLHVEDTK